MIKRFFQQLFSKNHPKWFRWLNISILLPILLYPFVFFGSLFIYDNPENIRLTNVYFTLTNLYPIFLVALTYFNSKLFTKNPKLAIVLPICIILGLLFFIGYFIAF